jgi:hypothetical protein
MPYSREKKRTKSSEQENVTRFAARYLSETPAPGSTVPTIYLLCTASTPTSSSLVVSVALGRFRVLTSTSIPKNGSIFSIITGTRCCTVSYMGDDHSVGERGAAPAVSLVQNVQQKRDILATSCLCAGRWTVKIIIDLTGNTCDTCCIYNTE